MCQRPQLCGLQELIWKHCEPSFVNAFNSNKGKHYNMNFIRLASTITPSFCTGEKLTDVDHQTLLNRSLFSFLSLRTPRQPKCSALWFKTMFASWQTESTAKSNFNQFDLWCALVLFATVKFGKANKHQYANTGGEVNPTKRLHSQFAARFKASCHNTQLDD